MKYWILIVGIFSLFTDFNHASEAQVTAKAYALGQAVTSLTQTLSALPQNPATLPPVTHTTLDSQAGAYFNGLMTSVYVSSAFHLSPKSTWAVYIPIRQIGGIPETTIGDNNRGIQTGTFSDTQAELGIAYAKTLPKWKTTLGIAPVGKWNRIQTETGYGLDLTIGALKTLKKGTLGIAVTQIPLLKTQWTTGYTESRPIHVSAGGSFQVFEPCTLYADTQYEETLDINTGLALKIHPQVTLMAGGNKLIHASQLRFGIGLTLPGLTLDYAFSSHKTLGQIHKIGVQCEI